MPPNTSASGSKSTWPAKPLYVITRFLLFTTLSTWRTCEGPRPLHPGVATLLRRATSWPCRPDTADGSTRRPRSRSQQLRSLSLLHDCTQVHQEALDVRPAQVGRPQTPSHGAERPLVPAQSNMIAVIAITVNAIQRACPARGAAAAGPVAASSCPSGGSGCCGLRFASVLRTLAVCFATGCRPGDRPFGSPSASLTLRRAQDRSQFGNCLLDNKLGTL